MTKAEDALERHLLKMKAMGVTITTKPAAGHEAGFGDRVMGVIQAAADRLGMGQPAPELAPAELAKVTVFGLHQPEDAS
jgi:hypothetical protein